jgi:hypothetical protein
MINFLTINWFHFFSYNLWGGGQIVFRMRAVFIYRCGPRCGVCNRVVIVVFALRK